MHHDVGTSLPAELLAAIQAPVVDYVEAWYAGDGARMLRSVHPDLAKRTVQALPPNGREYLEPMSASMLAEVTSMGQGRQTPPERQQKEIAVLAVDGGMASVKVRSADFVDYMHLALINGEWLIVNILWQWRAPRQP